MKSFLASLSVATLAFTMFSPAAHASVITDGLDVTINGAAVVGVYNPVLQEYVFTDTVIGLGVLNNSLLSESISTITATYTDVSGILGNLAVVDVCESITVLGSTASPCSNVAVVGTETGVGPLNLDVGTLALIGADITLLPDPAGTFGVVTADIGSASGDIGFGNPNPPSAVPEPGSLSLMATGLLAAAGAVRRKLVA